MKIYIASDHAGFQLKTKLAKEAEKFGQVTDLGPFDEQSVDYPDYAHKLCNAMQTKDKGILICGTGIGMSIAANRHENIRAALCRTIEDAKLAREHNDANLLCLGARSTDEKTAIDIVNIFFTTPSSTEERHKRRVAKI